MKTITQYRYASSDQGTKSIAFTGIGGFESFCILELPWRNNKPNYSCIPDGEYLCKYRESKRFKKHYHLQDVKGRSWVLTHSGNLAGDILKRWLTHSKGCLLLGARFGVLKIDKNKYQRAVLSSRPTLRKLITAMDKEDFILKIITLGGINV